MPTVDSLIAQTSAAVRAASARVHDADTAIDRVRSACIADGGRDPLPSEAASFRQAMADRDQARSHLSAAQSKLDMLLDEQRADQEMSLMQTQRVPSAGRPAYDQVVRTGAEPRTYGERSGRSFFSDAYNATLRGDSLAGEYLARSQREGRAQLEERAVSTGSLAGLIVPQYMVEEAALAVRNGRPLANLVKRLPLPDQGITLVVPRGTTGASAAAQSTENSAVSNTDEVWANINVPVCTVAGQAPVSRQALERGEPALDQLIGLDLTGAYASAVDNYVINGSGSSGQPLGILNTAGIGAATAFGAAPTWALANSKLAGQIVGIAGLGAGISAKLIVMHPRRWGWFCSLNDSQGRPMVVPTGQSPFNAGGVLLAPGQDGPDGGDLQTSAIISGTIQGIPVVVDANIPTTVGTNSEDVIIVLDTSQAILWEMSDGIPTMLSFEQTAGNNLTTTLVVYSYMGFTAGRFPGASAKIGGLDTVATQGLVAPAF